MHQRVLGARRGALLSATALAGTVSLALVAAGPAQAANCSAGDTTTLSNCITGAGNGDTITLTSNITLTKDLPAGQKSGTSEGANFSLSGNNQFRGLFVGAWTPGTATQVPVTVTIQDLTIQNAKALGGAGADGGGGGAGLGGAIFVANLANVTVSNVRLTGN